MEGFNQSLFSTFFALAHQNRLLDIAIIFIAKYLPYLLALGFLAFALLKKDHRAQLFILTEGALAVIISRSIITEGIRFFYHHLRPFAALNITPLVQESGYSFPSGHASILFSLAMVTYYFDKRLGGWFFLFAFLNGVARVVAGVHFPFDIVGGAIVGIITGSLVHALSKSSWEKMAKPTEISEVTDGV